MEYNVLIGEVKKSDIPLFFQGDKITHIFNDIGLSFQVLLRELGIVSSSSEAYRNGWHGEVPMGFTDRFFGRKKNRVTILKQSKEVSDKIDEDSEKFRIENGYTKEEFYGIL